MYVWICVCVCAYLPWSAVKKESCILDCYQVPKTFKLQFRHGKYAPQITKLIILKGRIRRESNTLLDDLLFICSSL